MPSHSGDQFQFENVGNAHERENHICMLYYIYNYMIYTYISLNIITNIKMNWPLSFHDSHSFDIDGGLLQLRHICARVILII